MVFIFPFGTNYHSPRLSAILSSIRPEHHRDAEDGGFTPHQKSKTQVWRPETVQRVFGAYLCVPIYTIYKYDLWLQTKPILG